MPKAALSTENLLAQFSTSYLLESWTDLPAFQVKKMFGGLAIYLNGKNVLYLCEDPKDHTWKGKRYPFPIWNGLLFPTSRDHHPSLMSQWPNLIPHPVLGKWLYLPQNAPEFESNAASLVQAIRKRDLRFGIEVGGSKKKKSPKTGRSR